MPLRKDLVKSPITPSEAKQELLFLRIIRNSIKTLQQQQQQPPVESALPHRIRNVEKATAEMLTRFPLLHPYNI